MKTFVLENDLMCVTLSERGHILSILHKTCGNIELIDSPYDASFFMNLMGEDCKEILVFEKDQEITAEEHAESVSFHMDKLKTEYGFGKHRNEDISLTLHVRLDRDSLLFSADVDNRTDLYIGDFEYPYVGVIKSLGNGKPTLYWPVQPGSLIMNVGEVLSDQPPHRENGPNTMRVSYPGFAMVSTYGLMDRESSLFISSEDPEFIACELKVIGSRKNRGALVLSVDKHLCCRNTSMQTAPIRMRLYKGDWHYSAAEYAKWMKPFRPTHEVPQWIREMRGYFLVINKQQYGYEMWNYDTLPQLYELAKAHGFDTLGLFGWYHTGHDNNYPDLEVSPTLGGDEVLRENIRKVQDAGGHVTLYHQGHLIDTNSDFYQSGDGKKVESRTIWGNPYSEYYPKSHRSDFLMQYSRRMFSLACPSCPEWRDLMVQKADWIASLCADGALYDQIGGMPPYICFNEDHPHDGSNPARALSGGQTKLVRAIQERTKEHSPEFAFMSEHFCDLYSSHLDAVHGCPNGPGGADEHRFGIGDDTGRLNFPDFHRYAFPETLITGRNPAPFCSRRFINYNFLYQFIPEMEIRYRADCIDVQNDTFKEERIYGADVSQLRSRYIKALSHSRYTDTDGITNADRLLLARGYALEHELYVTFWNDSGEVRMPDITVDGKQLVSFETMDGTVSGHLREIAAQEVAIALYR